MIKVSNDFCNVHLSEKPAGFAKIWAQVVAGIRLTYCELFFRPRALSRVREVPVPTLVCQFRLSYQIQVVDGSKEYLLM